MVEDQRGEGLRNGYGAAVAAEVSHHRDRLEVCLAQRPLEVERVAQVGRRGAAGVEFVERRRRIRRMGAVPSVQRVRGAVEDLGHLPLQARRYVDWELRVLQADEVRVDPDGLDELVVLQRRGIYRRGRSRQRRDPGPLPVGDVRQEANVLAREVLQRGKFQERPRVTPQRVLERKHGEHVAPARVPRPSAGLRLYALRRAAEGTATKGSAGRDGIHTDVVAPILLFPGGNRIESLLLKTMCLDDVPAGEPDDEGFDEKYGQGEPAPVS